MGEFVFDDIEDRLPSDIEIPKLDQVLTAEEFRELLVQDTEDLGQEDGNVSWILLLGYSVRDCRI